MAIDGGTPTVYAYDAADQLQSAGATTYSYDTNGSRIGCVLGGETTAYGYSPDGLLVSLTAPSSAPPTHTTVRTNASASIRAASRPPSCSIKQSPIETVLQETTASATATYVYGIGVVSRGRRLESSTTSPTLLDRRV